MKRAWLVLVLVALVAAVTRTADADVIERGRVVTIEENEIYFNIGADKQLAAGARLRFKRPIQLKHPVTAAVVSDWLPVGSAVVTAVGKQLSMARVKPDLRKRIKKGDVVEALVGRPEKPAATQPTRPPATPLPKLDRHTAQVLAVWQRTAGRSLSARILVWDAYLREHRKSPYAAAVREHIDSLRKLREELQPAELRARHVSIPGVSHRAPSRATAGQPIGLVFVLDRPRDVIATWLHYRRRGTTTYRRLALTRHHDNYLRGTIPGDAVLSPGVEYFVEVATSAGKVGAAVRSAGTPQAVEVPQPTLARLFEQRRRRSRVSVSTTYLDFATFDRRDGVRTDRFWLFEADFLYRLRKRIYGVRVGYGSFNGRGGYADRDFGPAGAPEAGFNYGYTEIELRANRYTSLMGRVIAGVGREGYGMGVAGRARFGVEDGTSLTLTASTIAEIGFLSELRMQWNAVTDVPLGLSVGLTDQPNRGDLGVRLTTSIGWRALSWFQPTLRISYQARTVTHAGIGAGLGMVFDW